MNLVNELTGTIGQDLQGHYALTPTQIDFFKREGFIKLKNVLRLETLAHYGPIITSEVKRLNHQSKPMEERTTYEKAFLQIMNIWTHNHDVKTFCFSLKLARIAAELMQVKGVRIYHDQALYKEANGGLTPWHADQYYWPLEGNNTCTVWIPLQKTPHEIGPLAFSMRSHEFAFGRDLEISDESEAALQKKLEEQNFNHFVEPFDLGEVSFHSGWTFHHAGPNLSEQSRAVMTVIYMEEGIRLAAPSNENQKADWATWMPGAEIGKPVMTKLNPILYSEYESRKMNSNNESRKSADV